MINYASYEFYANVYHGDLSSSSFKKTIVRASREIDKNVNCNLTDDLISSLSEKEQYQLSYTTCRMCDFIDRNSKQSNASSFSIDGVSKTLKSSDELKKEKKDIINDLPISLTRFL